MSEHEKANGGGGEQSRGVTQILPLCPVVLRTRKENSFSFGFRPSEVAWVGQHPVPLATTILSSVILLCLAGKPLRRLLVLWVFAESDI